MKFIVSLALAAIVLPLRAEVVRVSYSGVVASLTYADCTSFSAGSCSAWVFNPLATTNFIPGREIAVGEQFSGSFVYDTSVSAVMSSDGYQATYLNAASNAQFGAPNFALPDVVLPPAVSSGYVAVVDGRSGTDVFQIGANFSGADYFSNLYLSMVDLTGTALSGFPIPTSLDTSGFASKSLQLGLLRRSDGDQVQLAGTVSAISFSSAVPEPTSMLLVLLGGAIVFCTRRQSMRGPGQIA